jgi:hypothetical protein
MARTIAQIQQQITQNYVTAAASLGITINPTAWSAYNLQQLIIHIVATAMATFEQLFDQYTADVEAAVAIAAPGTAAWLQAQVFLFQYSEDDPQVVQFNTTTFAPYYPEVNASYKIITRCSVVPGTDGSVLIKVAQGTDPLTNLSKTQADALQSYINQIGAPGINYSVLRTAVSGVPDATYLADELYVQASITYTGIYAAVIQSSVIVALTAFCNNASSQPNFNGIIRVSDIILAIRGVAGVVDVLLTNVGARDNNTAFAAGSTTNNLVNDSDFIRASWSMFAGFIVPETTTGATLTDTLTFTAV